MYRKECTTLRECVVSWKKTSSQAKALYNFSHSILRNSVFDSPILRSVNQKQSFEIDHIQGEFQDDSPHGNAFWAVKHSIDGIGKRDSQAKLISSGRLMQVHYRAG